LRSISAVLALGIVASAVFGEEEREPSPEVRVNLRFLAWSHPKSKITPLKTPLEKANPTQVRFLSTVHYREGNSTKTLRLLPGKPTRSISYIGDSRLAFYRNNRLEGSPVFRISIERQWNDALVLLYPKTSAESSFNVFPIFRPRTVPGQGLATNLTGKPLYLSVDGRRLKLLPWQPASFRFSMRRKEHVRLEVQVLEKGTPKTVISLKKFLDKDDNPILLLRNDPVRNRLLLTTL